MPKIEKVTSSKRVGFCLTDCGPADGCNPDDDCGPDSNFQSANKSQTPGEE